MTRLLNGEGTTKIGQNQKVHFLPKMGQNWRVTPCGFHKEKGAKSLKILWLHPDSDDYSVVPNCSNFILVKLTFSCENILSSGFD